MSTKSVKAKASRSTQFFAYIAMIAITGALVTPSAQAAFFEPPHAPSNPSWVQDFVANIVGTNSDDNEYDSSDVDANEDGSVVERLEDIKEKVKTTKEEKAEKRLPKFYEAINVHDLKNPITTTFKIDPEVSGVTIGTTTNHPVSIRTNSTDRIIIQETGEVEVVGDLSAASVTSDSVSADTQICIGEDCRTQWPEVSETGASSWSELADIPSELLGDLTNLDLDSTDDVSQQDVSTAVEAEVATGIAAALDSLIDDASSALDKVWSASKIDALLTSITATINANTAASDANTAGVAANASSIAAIDTSAVESNTQAISVNTSSIEANASSIAAIDMSAVESNTQAIATNTQAIATNTAAIAAIPADTNTQLSDAEIAAMGYIKTYTDTNTQLADGDIAAMGYIKTDNDTQLTQEQVGIYATAEGFIKTDTNTQLSDAEIAAMGYIKTDTDTQLTDAEIAALGYIKTDTDTQLTDAEIAAMGYLKTDNDTQLTQTEVGTYATAEGFIKTDNDTQLTQEQVGTYATAEGFIKTYTDTNTQLSDAEIAALGYIKTDTDTQLTDAEIAAMGYLKTDNDTQLTQAEVGTYATAEGFIKTYTDTNTQLSDAEIAAMGYIKTDNDTQLTDAEITTMGYIKTDNDTQLTQSEVDTYAAAEGFAKSGGSSDFTTTGQVAANTFKLAPSVAQTCDEAALGTFYLDSTTQEIKGCTTFLGSPQWRSL